MKTILLATVAVLTFSATAHAREVTAADGYVCKSTGVLLAGCLRSHDPVEQEKVQRQKEDCENRGGHIRSYDGGALYICVGVKPER